MAVAGAAYLWAPLGALVLDGWDAESVRALLVQFAQVSVIVLLGHGCVVWLLRRVSWPHCVAGQLVVWSVWAAVAGFDDGSVTNPGEVIWGILVVGLPVALIALAVRYVIAPLRPDRRLRPIGATKAG